jgi:hypothetical protein
LHYKQERELLLKFVLSQIPDRLVWASGVGFEDLDYDKLNAADIIARITEGKDISLFYK